MSTSEAKPQAYGWLGRISRGVVIMGVLAAGVAAGAAILSYERKMPEGDGHGHGHGAGEHSESEKKEGGDDGHAHNEGDDDHGHADGGHAHGDDGHGEGVVKLSDKQRQNAKLTIEVAGPAAIAQELELNGIIQPNDEMTVAVLPRFGGIVRGLTKRLGDNVKKGEIVARIESNESLTQYEIHAPIDGTVIERSASLGEFAATDKRLMVISDLSTVWVDLRVYSQDFRKLKLGQKVEVDLPGHEERHSAAISYLSPIGLTDTQSMLARAAVENNDRGFMPGLFVTGHVQVSEQQVAVAVKQTALQYIENKPVVFVDTDKGFEKREVELGYKDEAMVEILFGVLPGDKVVTGNSFVLKSELGKAEAEHVH